MTNKTISMTNSERLEMRMACLREAKSYPDSVNVMSTLENAEKLENWLENGIIPPKDEKE